MTSSENVLARQRLAVERGYVQHFDLGRIDIKHHAGILDAIFLMADSDHYPYALEDSGLIITSEVFKNGAMAKFRHNALGRCQIVYNEDYFGWAPRRSPVWADLDSSFSATAHEIAHFIWLKRMNWDARQYFRSKMSRIVPNPWFLFPNSHPESKSYIKSHLNHEYAAKDAEEFYAMGLQEIALELVDSVSWEMHLVTREMFGPHRSRQWAESLKDRDSTKLAVISSSHLGESWESDAPVPFESAPFSATYALLSSGEDKLLVMRRSGSGTVLVGPNRRIWAFSSKHGYPEIRRNRGIWWPNVLIADGFNPEIIIRANSKERFSPLEMCAQVEDPVSPLVTPMVQGFEQRLYLHERENGLRVQVEKTGIGSVLALSDVNGIVNPQGALSRPYALGMRFKAVDDSGAPTYVVDRNRRLWSDDGSFDGVEVSVPRRMREGSAFVLTEAESGAPILLGAASGIRVLEDPPISGVTKFLISQGSHRDAKVQIPTPLLLKQLEQPGVDIGSLLLA